MTSAVAPAHHEYYEEDDEDVEYVEEIEYVDDTDEEGSYIVEEYVDEDEEEVEEVEDEGQGPPPVEISYDSNITNNVSQHEMSQGSLLHRDEDDGNDEPEEVEQEEEEEAEAEEHAEESMPNESKLGAEGFEAAAVEAASPEDVTPEEIEQPTMIEAVEDKEPVVMDEPAEEVPSQAEEETNEPVESAPAAATKEEAAPSSPRSLFQRRKSFGSSIKSIGSQKSNATSASAVSKSTCSASAPKPRPGLLRSGSSKSIRSIGKGIKNVFRRKSGKGNSKDETPHNKEEEDKETAPAVVGDSEPILDEPVAAASIVTTPELEDTAETVIEPAKEMECEIAPSSEAMDDEIPATSSSSKESATSYPAPATPEPVVKPRAAVAVTSPVVVSSPTHSVVRIKRDSAPVSPSRNGISRPAAAAAVTTTETTTTTTTTTSTTSVTTRRVGAEGAITSTTTSTTTSTNAKNAGDDSVQYSYSKDGKTYYTDKLEKQQDKLAWKKPEWTSSSPLRKTNKGVVLKEKGTLEKPIVIPVDKSVEQETGIGWSKPSWTKEKVLKSTEKGSALKSGAEIARPITGHTNQV